MSIKIAVTGKSGSGKTTITKALLEILQDKFPEKSILLFDNDLSSELAHSFGLDIRNTIYGIRSGKHEYKTGIPEGMTKHEYVEWAMEDIIVSLNDNVDIIVSWFVGAKDCRCPITSQINDACQRLIERYDFVAAGGQLGIVVNKVKNEDMNIIAEQLAEAEIDILGSIPFDESLASGKLDRKSKLVSDAVEQFYFRLNLPQENN